VERIARLAAWILLAAYLFFIYCLCKASSEAERRLFGDDYFYPEDQDRAIANWHKKQTLRHKEGRNRP